MSATTVVVEPTEKMRKPLAEFWRRFKKQKVAMVALIFIITLVLMAIFAPFVAPYDPTIPDYNAVLQGPSAAHWAGTDTYGRDIFSRIIWGARISLSVGFLSVTLGALVGVSLGIISGSAAGLSGHPAGDCGYRYSRTWHHQCDLCGCDLLDSGFCPSCPRHNIAAQAHCLCGCIPRYRG